MIQRLKSISLSSRTLDPAHKYKENSLYPLFELWK